MAAIVVVFEDWLIRKDSISFSSFLRIRTCPFSEDDSGWVMESGMEEIVPPELLFDDSAVARGLEDPGSVKFLQVVLGEVVDSNPSYSPCCIMSDEVTMWKEITKS